MTKVDLKTATVVDKSNLVPKLDLANLKAEADEIDIVKIKTIPTDLSWLSNVVDNDITNISLINQV